jgi:hypothetical protein
MNEFTQKLIEQAKDNPYFHLDGYMERYWLAPFKENGGNVRIHHILSSDADRHLHDHPWASTSVILDGGYWEVMPADPLQHPSKDADAFIKVWRAPGDVVTRQANSRHLIHLPEGKTSWSMFIMGPYEQKWGFYTEYGKVYWRDYLQDYSTETSTDKPKEDQPNG